MAMPIKPTPILRGQEAEAFEQKMQDPAAQTLKVHKRPSLDRAMRIVFCGNDLRKK